MQCARNPEQKIKELGLVLPAANYANAARSGNLLFLASKGPLAENGELPKGRLGAEFTVEDIKVVVEISAA